MAQGLGRGLSSLIPQKVNKSAVSSNQIGAQAAPAFINDRKSDILFISPDRILANPLQPRTEFNDNHIADLAESIRLYGVIQPLVVTRKGDDFELIAGERRLRASKKAGLDKVPVLVRDVSEQEKLELALIENIQRENLNPIETAVAYRKLMDEFGLTQELMAKRVGKSRSTVANTLRLLALPEEIRQAIMKGIISEGHAKLIAGLENEVQQMNMYRKILHEGLSVNDTLRESRQMGGTKAARIKKDFKDEDIESRLQSFFSTKVEIRRRGQGGQIVVNFYSDEELDEIIKKTAQ